MIIIQGKVKSVIAEPLQFGSYMYSEAKTKWYSDALCVCHSLVKWERCVIIWHTSDFSLACTRALCKAIDLLVAGWLQPKADKSCQEVKDVKYARYEGILLPSITMKDIICHLLCVCTSVCTPRANTSFRLITKNIVKQVCHFVTHLDFFKSPWFILLSRI